MRDLPTLRRLIVNADDFGLSPGVNAGIAEAFDRGIVTSASLMVDGAASHHAIGLAAGRSDLSVGLHLDLGEWVYEGGEWAPAREGPSLDDARAVRSEALRQLARFQRLMGRPPTHLDSHQHAHWTDPARTVVEDVAVRLGVPARGISPTVAHCGHFYGQTGIGEPLDGALTPEALLGIFRRLESGVTELGCHPGREADHDSVYAGERAVELDVLTDPRLPGWLAAEGIELISFADLAAAGVGAHA